MIVKVKLFAILRDRAPKKVPIGESFDIEVLEGCRIIDLLSTLKISEEEAKIVMVDHYIVRDYSVELEEGNEIAIFPPVGGG